MAFAPFPGARAVAPESCASRMLPGRQIWANGKALQKAQILNQSVLRRDIAGFLLAGISEAVAVKLVQEGVIKFHHVAGRSARQIRSIRVKNDLTAVFQNPVGIYILNIF